MLRVTLTLAAATAVASFVATTNLASRTSTALNAYVPDGLTPVRDILICISSRHIVLCLGLQEQWKAMKKKEEDSRKKKNYGAGGARGFKSRSMVRRALSIQSS